MVAYTNFDAFAEEAEKLYVGSPAYTRYSTKYRHCDGKLVLKVTNDIVTLTYATDQTADLKRVEKLNGILFARMSAMPPPLAGEFAEAAKPKATTGKARKR